MGEINCENLKEAFAKTCGYRETIFSKEDVNTSLLLKDKFSQFDIEFFDSIILTRENMYSFKKEGLL